MREGCLSHNSLINLMDRVLLQFGGLSLTTLQVIARMPLSEGHQGVPMFCSNHAYAGFSYVKSKINRKDRIFKASCEVFIIAVQYVTCLP